MAKETYLEGTTHSGFSPSLPRSSPLEAAERGTARRGGEVRTDTGEGWVERLRAAY